LNEGRADICDCVDVGKNDVAVERSESVRKEALGEGEVAVGDGVVEDEVEDGSREVNEGLRGVKRGEHGRVGRKGRYVHS
jgi:hypothetical protein